MVACKHQPIRNLISGCRHVSAVFWLEEAFARTRRPMLNPVLAREHSIVIGICVRPGSTGADPALRAPCRRDA